MDDFEDAFNEVPGGNGETTVATDPAPATAAVTPAPDPAPADEHNGHEQGFGNDPAPAPAPVDTTPAPAPAPADEDDPVKLRQKLRTLQGIAAKQGEDLRALNALTEELKQKSTAPAPAPVPAPAATSEDDELLAELEEASPTVAKAMRALIKKERAAMEAEVEQRVGKRVEELQGQIKPLREKAEAQVAEEHFSAIESKHPGWESVVASDQFVGWAQNQPLYVQREFARIAREGTANEVVDVLNSYRKDNPATPQGNNEIEGKRSQQRAALGGIPSRSTPVQTKGVDKDDFSAGFDGL